MLAPQLCHFVLLSLEGKFKNKQHRLVKRQKSIVGYTLTFYKHRLFFEFAFVFHPHLSRVQSEPIYERKGPKPYAPSIS